MSETTFQGLVDNIKAFGFRGALLVKPHPDPAKGKPYMIIDGEHRYKAMRVINALPSSDQPTWLTEELRGKIPAIMQELSPALQKLSTISMNTLHGDHDAIQQARLLVQITQDIGDANTLRLLGMRPIELNTAIAILNPPDPPPLATDGQDEPPVNITITLLPGQAMSYEQALQKAMAAMPEEDTLVLVKEQAHAYDEAMRKAIALGNIQKRGDAFAQICQWYLEADDAALTERFPRKQNKKQK